MRAQTTAIYVEDDEEWRSEVQQYIERFSDLKFHAFISRSSVEEVLSELDSVSGPTVIIMDLRLGEERAANYGGYHWLLDEWRDFLREHASSAIFVISGQLHEGIRETLIRRGISESHIYDKGNWVERRDEFLCVLKETVNKMDEIALQNIAQGVSGESIDPYLIHAFQAVEEEIESDISEMESVAEEPILLPMLVRTREKSWKYDEIPDLQVLGQIGNIFSCLGGLRAITTLEADPEVLNVEASRPSGSPDCDRSIPFVKADLIHQQVDEKGIRALIGIIDIGIDVLHEAFLDATGKQTRILEIWDQTDPTGPPPSGQQLGTVHTQDAINTYIQTGTVPDHLRLRPNDHGTYVASIAAGRAAGDFSGGVAPEANLVVVISAMDVISGKPFSLGYSVSHLLALKYIRSFAEERDLPVAINVSQGMNAGAHDGTSSLEKGFDAVIDNGQTSGIVIVKSAGNERNRGGHARLQMVSSGSEVLRWNSKNYHRGSDVVELWFKAGDQYRFRLCDPSGEKTQWVGLSSSAQAGSFPAGNNYQISFTKYDQDNGDSRLLITVTRGTQDSIALGEWSLEIESSSVKTSGEIHAWLERNNDRPVAFINHLSEEMTLSIPGTARHVITVGSIESSVPIRLAESSSFGPTRDGRLKPDLAAPGEDITAAKCGSVNGVSTECGTSMAAPHVAGAIALLFSHWEKRRSSNPSLQRFNAAQVQAAMTQYAQFYHGNWHPGLGFGVLDVETFLRELGST